MKIAFVGKGGSGKTTLSALFANYCSSIGKNVVLIDADLNLHLPLVMGLKVPSADQHLSHPDVVKDIRMHLRGSNQRIKDMAHFRKTTPPGEGSNLIYLKDSADYILSKYGQRQGSLRFLAVGTYSEEDIGASCYHNNLAILENVLSHTVDGIDDVVVTDMVAGVDAFSNTLHAQYDMLVLAVEPTQRGVGVYWQYKQLADAAGVGDRLFVVANKVADELDEEFVRSQIPADRLIGMLYTSMHLKKVDKGMATLSADELETENQPVMVKILAIANSLPNDDADRLQRLWSLHKKYVAQDFITERFGDLSGQIDPDFRYERNKILA